MDGLLPLSSEYQSSQGNQVLPWLKGLQKQRQRIIIKDPDKYLNPTGKLSHYIIDRIIKDTGKYFNPRGKYLNPRENYLI